MTLLLSRPSEKVYFGYWVLAIVVSLLFCEKGFGEDFSAEAFLLNASVADNGTSGALPSSYSTATQYIDYPGNFTSTRLFRLEMATLPLFGDLSQTLNGAFNYAIDEKTLINVFGQTITTSEIAVLPLLKGSREDRLNDPTFRPLPCDGCNQMRDVVYNTNINFMRRFDFELPRIDISTRPIPVQFSIGATTKYYYEELEGGDYLSQNLNADLGTSMKLLWGWDPVTKVSDRNVTLQVSGFELLPTKQNSEFSGVQVYESLTRRYHLTASIEEGFPSINSTVSLGMTQKSEQGTVPALGLEWGFQNMFYLRGGYDADYLSAGATVAWRWIGLNYAFRHHDLGTSLYQVSLQLQWP